MSQTTKLLVATELLFHASNGITTKSHVTLAIEALIIFPC